MQKKQLILMLFFVSVMVVCTAHRNVEVVLQYPKVIDDSFVIHIPINVFGKEHFLKLAFIKEGNDSTFSIVAVEDDNFFSSDFYKDLQRRIEFYYYSVFTTSSYSDIYTVFKK